MENVLTNPAALAAMKVAVENKEKRAGGVEAQKVDAKVAAGAQIAIVLDAALERNQPSQYGINDKVKITYGIITAGSETPVEIISSYWKASSEDSMYYRHLSPLLGKDPRQGFDLKELIGQACQVTIVHNETEKGIYANINDIASLSLDLTNIQI